MKKVVFRYEEEMMIASAPRHTLRFIVGEEIKEDVDIIKEDGTLEHGFRFENALSVSCDFGKVSTSDEIIAKLNGIIKGLEEGLG